LTPVVIKKDDDKENKSSSQVRTRSSKKLCERNRNHLRQKIMAKANEMITEKLKKPEPIPDEASKHRESSQTIKLKRPSILTRSGIAPSVKTRPTMSYLTPVNNTQKLPFSKAQNLSPNSNKKLTTTFGIQSRASLEGKRPLKQLAFKRRGEQLKPKSPGAAKRVDKVDKPISEK
jgi:hypothetical protein